MDIKLCKDKIDLIIDEMGSPEVLERVRNYTTVVTLLEIVQHHAPGNGYVVEKAAIITTCLEKLAGLEYGDSRLGSAESIKAKNALQDLVANFSLVDRQRNP